MLQLVMVEITIQLKITIDEFKELEFWQEMARLKKEVEEKLNGTLEEMFIESERS